MIKVGVGQEHSIYVFRFNWKRLPISGSEVPFLIQTAVDENALATALDQMAGTGNGAVGTVEGYFHASRFTWPESL